jgi:hypothetical protein
LHDSKTAGRHTQLPTNKNKYIFQNQIKRKETLFLFQNTSFL